MVSRGPREYAERGEAAFGSKEPSEIEALQAKVAELERFCGQLSWENAVLKKALQRLPSKPDMR
jgi:putative transposase